MSSITPTYHTSFPALLHSNNNNNQLQLQRRKTTSSITYQPSLSLQPLVLPKFPAYLKKTLYSDLVLKQYNCFKEEQQTNKQSSNNSPSTLNKLQTEELKELDLRLPISWNPKDKSKNIEIRSNGLDLAYIGPGKQETHAALARSNLPMPRQCGVFYYEMKVISKGDDGYIGLGFCCASNKLERLPGWDPDSWGYHGDDGHSFAGSGLGKTYGPRFSTGDIVGCGVDFADNSAFYTKNGIHLGIAFTDMDINNKKIYAAIGLRTPGERVTANFGHEPFVFDIEQYIENQKLKLVQDITTQTGRSQEKKMSRLNKEVMDPLVLSYLVHHGYTCTAKSVVQNSGHTKGQELFMSSDGSNSLSSINEKDMKERQLIRSCIVQGKIDDAIALIDVYFPGVLQEEDRGQELELKLKCGKFVEMMREYCESNKSKRMRTDSFDVSDGVNVFESQSMEQSKDNRSNLISTSSATTSPIPTPLGRTRRPSYAAIAASLSPSNSTELPTSSFKNMNSNSSSSRVDIDHSNTTESHASSGWCRKATTGILVAHEEQPAYISEVAANSMKLVMQYGQELQEEYRDTHEKTKMGLVEIFSLLAYPDPYNSPSAYLMNVSRRDALATQVNAAILAFQNRPERPALERIYRQLILTNKELVMEGNGKASLINIERYYADDLHVDKSSRTDVAAVTDSNHLSSFDPMIS